MQELREHLEAITKIKERLVSSRSKLIFLTVSGAHRNTSQF